MYALSDLVPVYGEIFYSQREAEERGRALVGEAGYFRVMCQPGFRIPTPRSLPDEFMPDRFYLLIAPSSR